MTCLVAQAAQPPFDQLYRPMAPALTAAALGVPEVFNAAAYFIDRHVAEGRGAHVAIECGDAQVTFADLLERVNRFGSALRDGLEIRPEERVVLLLLDGPAFTISFFGSIKIGAVPIPLNTLWKAADYRHALADSAARMVVVSRELLPELEKIPRSDLPALRHVVVVDQGGGFDALLQRGSSSLDAQAVSRDAPAFWLYSSGSTGRPKGCVHLQHDMVRLRRALREGRARSHRGGSLLQRAQAVLRLRARATRATSRSPSARPASSGPGRRSRRTSSRRSSDTGRPCSSRCRLATPCCWRTKGRSISRRSVLAVSAGEALPPAIYDRFRQRFGDRDHRRHRVDRGAPHVHLEPAWSEPSRHERRRRQRIRRAHSRRCGRSGGGGGDWQPVDQRRFDQCVLLESAREVEGHVPGRVAAHGRQVLDRTQTASSATRAVRTTC